MTAPVDVLDSVLAIGEPLAVEDMPEVDYFAHPALSASGAKRLLPPYAPAIFDWERRHGRPDKREFDLGHAAHQLVLGRGAPIHRVHADDWRTKAAKDEAAAARAAGRIPLLVKDVRTVLDMAKALRRHPVAGRLFTPGRGSAEVSLFWHDERFAVDRKCRIDWLVNYGGHYIVVDYKTANSTDPGVFSRQVANYGYHQQDAWYRDAVRAVLGDPQPGFVFVAQAKTPPYLVTIFELDADTVRIGRAKNDVAMEVFRDCTDAGVWPGYSDDIELIGLPAWADRDY